MLDIWSTLKSLGSVQFAFSVDEHIQQRLALFQHFLVGVLRFVVERLKDLFEAVELHFGSLHFVIIVQYDRVIQMEKVVSVCTQ